VELGLWSWWYRVGRWAGWLGLRMIFVIIGWEREEGGEG